jgi:hypothetical protein
VRAAVVRRLRARRGELAEAIFARVSGDAFAHAGDGDAEYLAGLRAAVAAAVDFVLVDLERGEQPESPIPPVALEQARRAARGGVSLDTVLRRYVVGHTLLGEYVMEEAEREELPGEGGALRGMLRAQAVVLDRLLAGVTAAYEDELDRAGRSLERRLLESVRLLLAGELRDGAAQLGGYELDREHVGAIARGAGAGDVLRELARGLDRRLLCVAQGQDTVWAWLGGRRGIEMTALQRTLSGLDPLVGVSFAVGEPARGLEGWRLTHRQAQAASMVALREERGRAG